MVGIGMTDIRPTPGFVIMNTVTARNTVQIMSTNMKEQRRRDEMTKMIQGFYI